MKSILIAAMAASLLATPALAADNAAFTGVRAELTAGVNDITSSPDVNDIVYGAAVGIDLPLGDKFTIGIEGNTSNVFEKERQIGAAARLGYAFSPSTLGYVKGGYNNYQNVFSRKLEGFVVGAGLEQKISGNTFVKVQYDYSDFEGSTGSHAGLVGVGIRF